MSKAVTFEEFLREIEILGNGEYEFLSGDYKNKSSEVTLLHKICGEHWKTTRDNFVNSGNRCRNCAKQMPWTKDRLQKKIDKMSGGKYTIIQEFEKDEIIPVKSDIRILNNDCGHDYDKLVSSLINQNFHNCKVCGKMSKNITTESFQKEIDDLTNYEYTVIGKYKTTHKPIKIRHNICGHEYDVSRTNFIGSPNRPGRRCPNCSKSSQTSVEENEITTFLKTFYDKEIIENDRKLLKGQEIDIYLPDNKIAIEFDGLYWHSEIWQKDKNYHLYKTLKCEEKGVRLIHIFEDEWLYKKEIVKSSLKIILGFNENPKIFAKDCSITELSIQDKDQFLEENHIQGKDKSSIRLGLWYSINDEEDRLIAVMTFYKSKNSNYKLSRFAIDIEFNIVGCFDCLFDYFRKNYEYESIKTIIDRRWPIYDLYTNNGFIIEKDCSPNCWHVKNKQRFCKDEILNESTSDNEYTKIWDCGSLVYEYAK